MSMPKLEKALLKFPWVGRLVWCAQSGNKKAKKSHEAQWKKLTDAFREKDRLRVQHETLRRLTAGHASGGQVRKYRQRQKLEQEQEQMQLQLQHYEELGQHISFPYPPLQELELNGEIVESKMMDKIFQYLPSLTRITIRSYLSAAVNMKAFLSGCPLLESIVLVTVELEPNDDCWLPEDLERQSVLRLRQLNLQDVYFRQSRLEELLAFTPLLWELKLESPRLINHRILRTICPRSYNGSQLVKCIKDLALPLRSFHFSYLGVQTTDPCLPAPDEWKIWRGRDLRWSDYNDALSYEPNVLTTLELDHWDHTTASWDSEICKYLAKSPQLLHLKAPKIAIPIGKMDVARVLVSDFADAGRTPPVIWACRGLLTLHIGFHGGKQGTMAQEDCTRVVFGYIARVCPLLRDLQIDGWESPRLTRPVYLRLKSGFCLLSKLKYLESLRIGPLLRTATFLEGDLEWMVPSGHTVEKRENRYLVADVWEYELRSERLEEEKRSGRPMPTGGVTDGLTVDDRIADMSSEMRIVFGRLGWLMDVRQLLEEMDAEKEGYQCWPKMQRLAICSDHPFGLSVEAEFERLSVLLNK
ncbi:hypothetical protein BGZ96_001753 [Linnemannia gamsii]|uniref:Uncharacterized protein n=1 Tax=Linnemannia gamsii TaxID=64522 RepID=A0ABQ7KA41_9FUNG|nr:hypothetical protein BGZ96_001753 [Linnemannia gamsii]